MPICALCVCLMAPRAVPSKPDPQGPRLKIWAFMLQNRLGGSETSCCAKTGFYIVCFCTTVFTCETVAREATEVHTEKYCVQRTRDCKCVFELFSPASRQRSEPGQKLIAAMFFFTSTTHLYIHPLCSDVAELLR